MMVVNLGRTFGFLRSIGVINTLDLILGLMYVVGSIILAIVYFLQGQTHCVVGYLVIATAAVGHFGVILARLMIWHCTREGWRRIMKKFRKTRARIVARLRREAGTTTTATTQETTKMATSRSAGDTHR